MIVKIVLADDEPPALRLIKNIVESCGPDYQVIFAGYNGREVWGRLSELKPDLLITDIRMPLMDGLALVEQVQLSRMETACAIISGHQDFSYARKALQFGVIDYLLKPVEIQAVQALLEKVKQEKILRYTTMRSKLLNLLLQGNPEAIPTAPAVRAYLPATGYRAAVIRFGALPSRFSHGQPSAWRDPGKSTFTFFEDLAASSQKRWRCDGRDDAECMLISQEADMPALLIDTLAAYEKENRTPHYTAAVQQTPVNLENLRETVHLLTRLLDENLVLGKNMILSSESEALSPPPRPLSVDSRTLPHIVTLASTGRWQELKDALVELFGAWESAACPQWYVEHHLRQLAGEILRNTSQSGEQKHKLDIRLDEAFSFSITMGELLENIWHTLLPDSLTVGSEHFRLDTVSYWAHIQEHISENLSHPLSLGSLCDALGISQTYLSRLFRKYSGMTCNEYITSVRIEQAKRLLEQERPPNIQEIAAFVGYDTPSYFSKVFRKQTGFLPSEFQKNCGSGT